MSQLPGNESVSRNNERLFLLYDNQLKKQTSKDYADTAIKLATWLSDPKAYYTAARPQIVNLLLTAQMTLREAVHYTTDVQVSFNASQFLVHPLTASYVRLVQTVTPFRDLFVEPHLKVLILRLLRSVEDISLPTMSVFPPPSSSTNQQLPSASSTVLHASGLQSADKYPVLASSVISPKTRDQSTSQDGGATVQKGSSVSDPMQDVAKGGTKSLSPEIVCLGMSKANLQPSAQDNATLTTRPENAVKAIGKSKSKKKKKIDISAFLQTDRQDFERKQAQSQRQVLDSAPFIKSEPETEQLPPFSADGQDVLVASNPRFSSNQPSAVMPLNNPQDSLILSIPGHVSPTAQSSISQAEGSCPSLHVLSSPTGFQLPSGQTFAPQNTEPAIERKARKVTPAENATSQAFQNQASTLGTISPLATTSPIVRDLNALSLESSTGRLTTNASGEQSHESGEVLEISTLIQDGFNVSPPVEEHAQDHNSSLHQIQSAQTRVAQPLIIHEDSELGRLFKWHEEYQLTQPHTKYSITTVGTHPQGSQEHVNIAADLADDLIALARVSDGKVLQVLALSPSNAAKHYLEFSFETSVSDMEPLLQWVNRSTVRLKQLISCYCLSLGCYSSQELKRAINRKPNGAPEVVLKSAIEFLPSIWPRDGGLSMTVSVGDSRKVLPLSPPFFVTGDGLVDVSEFIILGENRLQIHQSRDFPDYTFVLQVHAPKFKELQEVVEHRTKEMEWKNWLVEITQPLETSTA